MGAGGARIPCYSSRLVLLQFNCHRKSWDFQVEDVKKAIIGADLLTYHGLVMDLQRGCVLSNEDQHLVLPCSLHVLSNSGEYSINQIQQLLRQEYRNVAGLEEFEGLPPAYRVFHNVSTTASAPLHSKVRPLSEE